jgi:hypothetical protein
VHHPITDERAAVASVRVVDLVVLELAEVTTRPRVEVVTEELQKSTTSGVENVHAPIDASRRACA